MAARSLWYGLDLVSLPLRRPHQPRLVLAGAADCPAVDRSARLIGQAIHLLNGQRSFTSSLTFSSDFALDDLFKVVDPRAYRLLPSADRPTLILKAFGTALFLWIYSATAIKRLHDRDRSGWWIVPFFVVPGLFSQFSDLLPDSNWVLAIVLVMQISVAVGVRRNVLSARQPGQQPVRSRSAG